MAEQTIDWVNGSYRSPRWAVAAMVVLSSGMPAVGTPAAVPKVDPDQSVESPADADSPRLQPRFELHVPSVQTLLREARRSHAWLFAATLGDLFHDQADSTEEMIDPEALDALVDAMAKWSDTSLDLAVFAPDTEGRVRWSVRLDWPLPELRTHIDELLEAEAADTLFEDLRVTRGDQDGCALRLHGSTLVFVRRDGAGSMLASPGDIVLPRTRYRGVADQGGVPVAVCRLRVGGTEQDSGATVFSSFSAITAVEYAASVSESGAWHESVRVSWPPISGMGAKLFFGRIKKTFFVPDEAFGAVVIDSMMATGVLEGMIGLGPQVIADAEGDIEVIGEPRIGPIARHAGSALCVTVLPGTGFLPMPDIVVQTRAKRVGSVNDDIREAIASVNELYRQREEPEPWHEISVRNRPVFWSDGGGAYRGMIMPVTMKPVLFLTKDKDAKGKERDYLVAGWTSTSPEKLVRRWVDLPRTKDCRHLPTTRKTNGQAWLNWKRVYRWIEPYINISISAVGVDSLLPAVDGVSDRLSDAMMTAKLSYANLSFSHEGPVPLGTLILPAMLAAASETDQSGGTDLARERVASQRLRVLHHHATLFKKDHDRWPAEVAELDGYVDFAGNPYLLELRLSSKHRWGEWFSGIFEMPEDEEEIDEDDDVTAALDDDLYRIEWGRESWRLGYAPATFEHLDKLYIDQDGAIHRVPKKTDETEKMEETSLYGPSEPGRPSDMKTFRTVAKNLTRPFAPPHRPAR